MVKEHKEIDELNLVFISFLDENNVRVDNWVEIINEKENSITFKTDKNIFTIPLYRLLKIKKRIEKGII